jgi:hypothetical protein
VSFSALHGCDSEKSKLENEKIHLEVEKLKREADEAAAQKEARQEIYNTDKLKAYKPRKDPF